jgi:hypothetical protein
MKIFYCICFFFVLPLTLSANEEYLLIIKDHKFIPDILEMPANKKIKLIVHNQDDEVEEFESFDLRREKIIPAKGKIKVNIGPLEPGEYKFFGEFHIQTAQGKIIVKE